jgi:hypothetical protein
MSLSGLRAFCNGWGIRWRAAAAESEDIFQRINQDGHWRGKIDSYSYVRDG